MKKQKTNNKNPIQNWWYNLTHIKKNYKTVKSSPYASLLFAIRIRRIIVWMLIPYIAYRGVKMVLDYQVGGFMNLVGKIIMLGIFAYIIYRIWKTIPDAKKQLEYYKKYPHTINYCPTNVKEDINDIIKKIKENKEKKENEKP
jgi:hypothetical protein